MRDNESRQTIYLIAGILSASLFIVGIIFYCCKNDGLRIAANVLVSFGGSLLSASLVGFMIERSDRQNQKNKSEFKAVNARIKLRECVDEIFTLLLETFDLSEEDKNENIDTRVAKLLTRVDKAKIKFSDFKKSKLNQYKEKTKTDVLIMSDIIDKYSKWVDEDAIFNEYIVFFQIDKLAETARKESVYPDKSLKKYIWKVTNLANFTAYVFRFNTRYQNPISYIK